MWTSTTTQAGPTYGSAHVFFTSKVAPQHLAALRSCPGLLSRLRALAEVRPRSVAGNCWQLPAESKGAELTVAMDTAESAWTTLPRCSTQIDSIFSGVVMPYRFALVSRRREHLQRDRNGKGMRRLPS